MKHHSVWSIILTLLWLVWQPSLAQGPYGDENDPAAVEAAEQAVRRLGPSRGAIALKSAAPLAYSGVHLGLVGLPASSLGGESRSVERALKDLGARATDTGYEISLSGDVLFDFDQWNIRPEAEESLAKLAQLILELNKTRVLIEGHTDAKGSESYNQSLSLKRAASVRDWFIARGTLKHVVFEVAGRGEAEPIAPNANPDGSDNPEGRAANRRVEIQILD